jgi:hypothetical protein
MATSGTAEAVESERAQIDNATAHKKRARETFISYFLQKLKTRHTRALRGVTPSGRTTPRGGEKRERSEVSRGCVNHTVGI